MSVLDEIAAEIGLSLMSQEETMRDDDEGEGQTESKQAETSVEPTGFEFDASTMSEVILGQVTSVMQSEKTIVVRALPDAPLLDVKSAITLDSAPLARVSDVLGQLSSPIYTAVLVVPLTPDLLEKLRDGALVSTVPQLAQTVATDSLDVEGIDEDPEMPNEMFEDAKPPQQQRKERRGKHSQRGRRGKPRRGRGSRRGRLITGTAVAGNASFGLFSLDV
ncbi:MAG: hypothetical protein MHM6MM_003539 [Cercozoa sp. M6MM]